MYAAILDSVLKPPLKFDEISVSILSQPSFLNFIYENVTAREHLEMYVHLSILKIHEIIRNTSPSVGRCVQDDREICNKS